LASWLQVCHADLAAARGGAISIKQAEHARKRQDSAHRRHLAAVAALATVRKLPPSAALAGGKAARTPGRSALGIVGDSGDEPLDGANPGRR
jgi:hypothetical protein